MAVAEHEVLHDDDGLPDVLLKTNINMHYPLRELPRVRFHAKVHENDVLQFVRVVAIIMIVDNVLSQNQHTIHLTQGIVIIDVTLDVIHEAVRVTATVASGLVQKYENVIRAVHLLQDVQVVLEARDRRGNVRRIPRDVSIILC